MPVPLTASERDQYQKRGFFVRERLLDPLLLAELRDAVEGIHRQISGVAERRDYITTSGDHAAKIHFRLGFQSDQPDPG